MRGHLFVSGPRKGKNDGFNLNVSSADGASIGNASMTREAQQEMSFKLNGISQLRPFL